MHRLDNLFNRHLSEGVLTSVFTYLPTYHTWICTYLPRYIPTHLSYQRPIFINSFQPTSYQPIINQSINQYPHIRISAYSHIHISLTHSDDENQDRLVYILIHISYSNMQSNMLIWLFRRDAKIPSHLRISYCVGKKKKHGDLGCLWWIFIYLGRNRKKEEEEEGERRRKKRGEREEERRRSKAESRKKKRRKEKGEKEKTKSQSLLLHLPTQYQIQYLYLYLLLNDR